MRDNTHTYQYTISRVKIAPCLYYNLHQSCFNKKDSNGS